MASDGDGVVIPDKALLFTAEFERAGPDLVLRNADAPDVRVVDYFRTADPADLTTPEGAVLRGPTVERLAGPEAPGQYAQAGTAPGAAPIGQVETLEGVARVQRVDGTVEQLSVGEKVYRNDVVITGDGTTCAVTFVDGTIFTLAANSRMVLDELIFDPDGGDNAASFSLVEGTFVFVAGQVARTGGMEVTTPAATMGIRGTTVGVQIDTSEGTVAVTLRPDLSGEVGLIDVRLSGSDVVQTIAVTDTTFIFSPGTAEVREVPREADDPDLVAVEAAAYFAQAQAEARAADTGVFVDNSASGSRGGVEQETPGSDGFDTGVDDPLGDIPDPAERGDGTLEDGGDGGDGGLIDEDEGQPGGSALPDPNDETRAIEEDGTIVGRFDYDAPAGVDVTFSLVEGPTNGVVAISPDGTFSYRPAPDYAGDDAFVYAVRNPATGEEGIATVTLTVDPVNDAPTAVAEDVALAEDGQASGAILADDVDGDDLTISVTQDVSHGALTLRPDGSFDYIPEENFAGEDGFAYEVSDGQGGVVAGSVSITVSQVNDAPVADDGSVAGDEDSVISGTVTGSDVDPGPAPTFVLVGDAANGTVTLRPDGSFDYVPQPEFSGTDSFTFAAFDGEAQSAPATVEIVVTPVNDAPEAGDITLVTSEDSAQRGAFDGQDRDNAPGELVYDVVDAPRNGRLSDVADGGFTYTPDPDFSGTDSLSYTVSDGSARSRTALVEITVTPVNDPPVLLSEPGARGQEDGTAEGIVQAEDPDGDPLDYSVLSQGSQGTARVFEDGSFVYTPEPDTFGTDSFTVRVSDGNGGTLSVDVPVEIGEVNDPPEAFGGPVTVPEDATVEGTVTAIDADGDALAYAVVTDVQNGALTFGPDGSYSYAPAADFAGTDSFTYRVDDGRGGTDSATVTLTVAGENDAPTADALAARGDEDTELALTPSGSDPEGDALSFAIADAPANGQARVEGGQIVYTPDADFNGTDSFSYTASDGVLQSAPAPVEITIDPVNDAPVAPDARFETDEDVALSGALAARDVDGDALAHAAASAPASGTLDLAPDGVFTYTPAADFTGTDRFDYIVTDGQGGRATGTVRIDVTSENDAPVADPKQVNTDEDVPVSVMPTGSDVDGDPLTFEIAQAPLSGTVQEVGGAFVYTPGADFDGTDSFTYTATDGDLVSEEAVVTISVAPVNDAPVAGDDGAEVDEDGAVAIPVLDNDTDVDGDALSVAAVGAPANGTAQVAGDGTITYTPEPDFNGTDSFTYTVSDGRGGTDSAAVTVTVAPVNDAPVADAKQAATPEDAAVSVMPTGSDVDGDALDFERAGAPAFGTVRENDDGTFTYTPDENFNGTDSFTYVASDGALSSPEAVVTIDVAPVNDAPVLSGAFLEAEAGAEATGGLAVADPDTGDSAAFEIVADPADGTASVDGPGNVAYTPDPDFAGIDRFDVTVTDGAGASDTARVNVAVGASAVAAPNGQELSVVIDTEGDTGAAGSVGIFASAPDPAPVTLVIALDRSGSIRADDWTAITQNTVAALDTLSERFAESETPVLVQIVSYASAATILGESAYDLVADIDRLSQDILAIEPTGGSTNWNDAFFKAREVFDEIATAESQNFHYFVTDGEPSLGAFDVDGAYAALTDAEARGYTLQIEAFAIGDAPNLEQLAFVELGRDLAPGEENPVTSVDGPSDLAEAFAATPLFAAELVSFSLELLADGVVKGQIADETSPALAAGALTSSLTLAEIAGIDDLLGEQNILQAEAIFDLDGDLSTTADRQTLVETGALSVGTAAVDRTGTGAADVLPGSSEADTLDGAAGDDLLIGGDGDDVLIGGGGVDSLLGGAGDDLLDAGAAQAGARVDGGAGRDTLRLASGDGGTGDLLPSLELAGIEAIDLTDGAGDDVLGISLHDVLDLSDTPDSALEALLGPGLPGSTATVTGDAGDEVVLRNDEGAIALTGTASDRDSTYDVYSFFEGADMSGEVLAVLAVEQDVVVAPLPSA